MASPDDRASTAQPVLEVRASTAVPILEVQALTVRRDSIEVIHGLEFSVERGEMLLLLGANGAGKTTLLRALSGLIAASGIVRLAGHRIDSLRAEYRVAAGLMQVPDTRGLFLALSVEDNLRLGAHTRGDRAAIAADLDWVWQRFPKLHERRRQQAGALSGGEQQMLAIGRALMARPSVLMIDEPSAGLAPQTIETIQDLLLAIREELGVALLIAEQARAGVSAGADRVMHLDAGRVAFLGSPDDPGCIHLLSQDLTGRCDP